ncbi:MAG: pilus assembly protein TadG-related protein, partial [Deltaproteobacteria bacterium]
MIKKRLKNKTGQVAIFVLMMFSLIFMFFGMAINIGMLVHHKINLQNAADMGALAAAAEQARILNMIGWKNYELRKNFKDFIYRYWVGFNDRHEAFPDPRDRKRRGNLARQGKWTEVMNTIPSYCFGDNFDEKGNRGGFKACEVSKEGVSTEVIGPPPGLIAAMAIEPISATLLAALHLRAIQLTKETIGNWKAYSQININGAFNEVIGHQRRSEDIFNTYLNPNRADTLSRILNQVGRESFPQTPPPAWLNFANRNAGFDPRRSEGFRMDHYVSPLFEVPVDYDELARITVFNNLNANLQERLIGIIPLRPQNGYIHIRPITPPFFVFYTTFDIRGNKMRPKRDNSIPVDDFIVGVEKDPNVKTFYLLMVKSQPELPFLPGLMPWELTAVAAA